MSRTLSFAAAAKDAAANGELPQTAAGKSAMTADEFAARVAARMGRASCDKCNDAGYLRNPALEPGDPGFGRVLPCPACNRDVQTARCGLNDDERKITAASIITAGKPGAAAMMAAARKFIAGSPERKPFTGFLTLHGSYGNGKTTVAMAIVNAALKRGMDARYMTAKQLADYAREAFESTRAGDSDAGRIAEVAAAPLVVVDELHSVRQTDYVAEMNRHFFDLRYRGRSSLGTIIVFNGDFSVLEDTLPSVASRCASGVIVHNADQDMRDNNGVH